MHFRSCSVLGALVTCLFVVVSIAMQCDYLILPYVVISIAIRCRPECSGRAIMIRTHNPTLGTMKRINRIIVETAGSHEVLQTSTLQHIILILASITRESSIMLMLQSSVV